MTELPHATTRVKDSIRRAARTSADWVDLAWWSLDKQVKAVAKRARGRLLDVGCGEKPYEHIFRPYVEAYTGIEYQQTFERTESSARKKKPDLYYDGVTIPFEDSTFDTVISIQVLEHTPRPQHLVNEMARVVKRDGLVALSAPLSFRLHEEPHDYFRYTPHGLDSMMQAAGLVMEECWPQGDLWTVLAHKFNSHLAFRVARLDVLAQRMGKLGHEDRRGASPRYWTMPFVLPTMVALSAAARVLDRVVPDGTESLGYMVLARRR
jgi:SAM-dependent methyltransferase